MHLNELKPGECGIIKEMDRKRGIVNRLIDLGIVPGTKITVISAHPFSGPIILDVSGSRVAIGRKIAEKIAVEEIKASEQEGAVTDEK